ncbi:MAG: hypothetical protein ABGW98_09195, partial [Myxococcales bacterium]
MTTTNEVAVIFFIVVIKKSEPRHEGVSVLFRGVLLSPRFFAAALFVVLVTATVVATPAVAQTSFVAFESGHVRPITLSPN